MDAREIIVQKVMESLHGQVDEKVVGLIQDVLVTQLNFYEVTERCTEVAVQDESAEGILRKFLATKRVEGMADSTLHRYADINRALINYISKPLGEITTFDIRFYLATQRQGGKVSNYTLDGMRRCFSSFFSWVTAEGLIERNPCATLARIKSRKTVKKPYSEEEMKKIRKACKTTRDLALVDFLYASGCRVSEVVGLNVSDVDFAEKECIVLGKGNKERRVYLTTEAALHLQEYLNARNDSCEALFVGKGRRLGKNGIEAIMRKLGKEAGVDNVHPHRYRRTLATNLLDRGMPIQDVAAILGHVDLKTTQIYCYISQDNVKKSYIKYAA